MRITYDAATDTAYLSLRAVRQGEPLGPTLLLEGDRDFPGAVALDFGEEDGRAVGLEFQTASACLPAELLAAAVRTDARSLADRYAERVAPRLGARLRLPGHRPTKPGRDVRH